MRFILILLFLSTSLFSIAQDSKLEVFKKDSLLIFKKNPIKGFQNDYILFIPKGTPINKKIVLLVEPNNTGKTSDSISVHEKYAIDLASVSSVGNNVATMLKIPLLVPIFPRPSSQELIYTHALDRDVILDDSQELKRLDLQLIVMKDFLLFGVDKNIDGIIHLKVIFIRFQLHQRISNDFFSGSLVLFSQIIQTGAVIGVINIAQRILLRFHDVVDQCGSGSGSFN